MGIKNYTGQYDPQSQANREKAINTIRKAYERGINYFDTASAYGYGASEEIYGEALSGLPEDKVFLATKVRAGDYSETQKAIEASLKRLRPV